jgi:hypothetical protein
MIVVNTPGSASSPPTPWAPPPPHKHTCSCARRFTCHGRPVHRRSPHMHLRAQVHVPRGDAARHAARLDQDPAAGADIPPCVFVSREGGRSVPFGPLHTVGQDPAAGVAACHRRLELPQTWQEGVEGVHGVHGVEGVEGRGLIRGCPACAVPGCSTIDPDNSAPDTSAPGLACLGRGPP